MNKQELIKCINWITRKDSPYAIMYGGKKRFATNDKDLTTEEVVNEYLQSHPVEHKTVEEILNSKREDYPALLGMSKDAEKVILEAMQEYASQLPSDEEQDLINGINN